jgi:hypothetical protein
MMMIIVQQQGTVGGIRVDRLKVARHHLHKCAPHMCGPTPLYHALFLCIPHCRRRGIFKFGI